MAIDYTKWPSEADVFEVCASAGITLRNIGRATSCLNGVIRRVGTETRRQFVAGAASETRYYDGSGGVELEIPDELISLSGAQIISFAGLINSFAVPGPFLIQEQSLSRNRILMYQGSAPASLGIFLSRWPQGYKNIAITGQFGYGATIPEDLWEAVAEEAAAILIEEARTGMRGVVTEKREGDNMTKWDGGTNTQEMHRRFRRALKAYARPLGQRLRRQRVPIA